MSHLKASLTVQPKAIGFTVDNDILISGDDKEDNLTCFRINQDGLSQLTSLKVPEANSLNSLSCHSQFPLVAVGCEKGTFIYVKENDQIQLETKISSPTNTGTKVLKFSSTGNYLVTVSDDDALTILDIRDWSTIMQIISFKDIKQVDFDTYEEHLAILTPIALIVLSIQDKKVVQVIDSPKLNKKSTEFFTCRYTTDINGQERLFGVVNTLNERGFLCCWDIRGRGFVQYPTTKVRNLAISRSKITAFEVSVKGDILAYGSKDGSIGLVDIKQLRPVRKFRNMHQGGVISLIFNYSNQYIASIGEDEFCKVTALTNEYKRPVSGLTTPLFVALDMLLFALMMHIIVQMVDQGTLILP